MEWCRLHPVVAARRTTGVWLSPFYAFPNEMLKGCFGLTVGRPVHWPYEVIEAWSNSDEGVFSCRKSR